MKKVTKKQIAKTLRTLNSTEIFKLAKKCGVDVNNRHLVCEFIRENAKTKKVYQNAWRIASVSNESKRPYYKPSFAQIAPICNLINKVREEKKSGKTSYSKMLIIGNSNIYWASPVYQHSDYNKSKAMVNNEKNREIAAKINKILGYDK